jgi:DNA-binding NtrC family response regulator
MAAAMNSARGDGGEPDLLTSGGADGESLTPRARVLVVDDFSQVREMLVHELARAGFAADGAASPRQAYDMHAAAYDALVVDQRLGGEFGTDIFGTLYDEDEAIANRFILMTGDQRGIQLPPEVPILLKPFRIAVLVDTLRRMLDR